MRNRINTPLNYVPYELPPQRAREVAPILVGTRAIKIYRASPMFWAVAPAGAGCYRIQFATTLGAGHCGFLVTSKAAAEFIGHTAHPFLLLAQIQKLGWLDLATEFETVVAQIIKTARRVNQLKNQNETFAKN